MRRALLVLGLLAVPAGVRAQAGPDSTGPLIQIIRARWHVYVTNQLQLSPDQSAKLQATEDKFDGMRRPIQRRQVEIARALNAQLQPGVAADNDRVTKLLAEQQENRGKLQDLDRQQEAEMAGYLTPVQRVRYQRQRELFRQRVQRILEGRPGRLRRGLR